jgi:hypothetical protein
MFMSIAVGITFIVVGAIFKFALSSGKIAGFNLQIIGVILIIAGIVGMLLPFLIRNRSRFSRPIASSRQDVIDEESRTLVEHTDGSQTVVEHFDADAIADGQGATGRRQPWAGSGQG